LRFLDSNIIVYSVDHADARKRDVAESIVVDALQHGTAVISFQVVQETINVLTRRFAVTPTRLDTNDLLRTTLDPLWRINPSPALYRHALEVHELTRISFCDALIVAAALEAGCDLLYTEDLQHGQRFGALTVENPFL
jgi:predicted nucleic acid-binding protein